MSIVSPSAQQRCSSADERATAPKSCQELPPPRKHRCQNQYPEQPALNRTNCKVPLGQGWLEAPPGVSFWGGEVAEKFYKSSSLFRWLSRAQGGCATALACCICLKVSDADLKNHLRHNPPLLTCFVCAAFSSRHEPGGLTGFFIKSRISLCCECWPLLLLRRGTARGFVSSQHSPRLEHTSGAMRTPCHAISVRPHPAAHSTQRLSTQAK